MIKSKEVTSVEQYTTLVKKIANNIHQKTNYINNLDDLIQSGMIGLLDALDKYKKVENSTIETYLSIRIQGAILDEIRKSDYLSQDDRTTIKKIDKLSYNKDGKKNNTSFIAKELNMEVNQIHLIKSLDVSHISLNQEENEYLSEIIESKENIENYICNKERATALSAKIENLPEKEKQIMGLYYQEELTLKEIAYIVNLTEARVSQIHNQIIKKLKEQLSNY